MVSGRGPGRWFRWREAVGFDLLDGNLEVGRIIASRFPLLALVPSGPGERVEPEPGSPRWLAGVRAQARQRRVVAREFFGPLWDEAATFV